MIATRDLCGNDIPPYDVCIVGAGYKGHVIKDYFANYILRAADVTFDLASSGVTVHRSNIEPWRVTVVDTGVDTMTGGRLKRVHQYLRRETFCMTYGDGVADLDVAATIAFHRKMGKLATLTAVQPQGRFGSLSLQRDVVMQFKEKPVGDGGWINGGFFVLEPSVLDYIESDDTVWENGPLQRLALEGQLCAYQHQGFWQPMDTLRDRDLLERHWNSGRAPWKVW